MEGETSLQIFSKKKIMRVLGIEQIIPGLKPRTTCHCTIKCISTQFIYWKKMPALKL